MQVYRLTHYFNEYLYNKHHFFLMSKIRALSYMGERKQTRCEKRGGQFWSPGAYITLQPILLPSPYNQCLDDPGLPLVALHSQAKTLPSDCSFFWSFHKCLTLPNWASFQNFLGFKNSLENNIDWPRCPMVKNNMHNDSSIRCVDFRASFFWLRYSVLTIRNKEDFLTGLQFYLPLIYM